LRPWLRAPPPSLPPLLSSPLLSSPHLHIAITFLVILHLSLHPLLAARSGVVSSTHGPLRFARLLFCGSFHLECAVGFKVGVRHRLFSSVSTSPVVGAGASRRALGLAPSQGARR
jgi:hypothetical protein